MGTDTRERMCTNPLILADKIVPCGKCYSCQMNRRSELALRNQIELYYSDSAYFITLTYDDNYIIQLPCINDLYIPTYDHIQKYLKSLRKYFSNKNTTLRFFLCHEYGSLSFRPHYHLILYFDKFHKLKNSFFQSFWKYGFTKTDSACPATIHYMSKYICKAFRNCPSPRLPAWLCAKFARGVSFITYKFLCDLYSSNVDLSFLSKEQIIKICTFNKWSKSPFLGYRFFEDSETINKIRNETFTNLTYPTVNFFGLSFKLPRTFIQKIFSDSERELIYNHYLSNCVENDLSQCSKYNLDIETFYMNQKLIDERKLERLTNKITANEKI